MANLLTVFDARENQHVGFGEEEFPQLVTDDPRCRAVDPYEIGAFSFDDLEIRDVLLRVDGHVISVGFDVSGDILQPCFAFFIRGFEASVSEDVGSFAIP